jgi:hypothetical protein
MIAKPNQPLIRTSRIVAGASRRLPLTKRIRIAGADFKRERGNCHLVEGRTGPARGGLLGGGSTAVDLCAFSAKDQLWMTGCLLRWWWVLYGTFAGLTLLEVLWPSSGRGIDRIRGRAMRLLWGIGRFLRLLKNGGRCSSPLKSCILRRVGRKMTEVTRKVVSYGF